MKRSKAISVPMKMKKLRSAIAIGLTFLPLMTLAQPVSGITPVTVPKEVNIADVISRILNTGFAILLLLAAVFILAAAYFYLTAAGDETKIGKAKSLIIYAVVAIVVAFLARGIVFIVAQLLQPGIQAPQ